MTDNRPSTIPGFEDVGEDTCPGCGHEIGLDDENDWNHVIRDDDGNAIALTLECVEVRGPRVSNSADHGGPGTA